MSSPSLSSSSRRKQVNPFPASAVTRFSEDFEPASISIATPVGTQAAKFVRAHIADGMRGRGNVMAISGEYGAGKTHLALELLQIFRGDSRSALTALYLDAPADNFLSLYRDRFIPKLRKEKIFDLVDRYYAKIIATELAGSDLTKNASELLRAGTLKADEVVERFGLPQSLFLTSLNEDLRTLTAQPDFATALALLVRPQFEAAAWEWLCGSPPDPVLVERGVERAIDSDASALEAMGVFAFLFSEGDERLVLVMDEMEKLVSPETTTQSSASTNLALKRLIEIISRTDAFLIMCGLPEFFEALPEDALQRIGFKQSLSQLSAHDAIEFVRESQRVVNASADLSPFNEDSISYVTELTGGNPRRIVRLCHYIYDAAARGNAEASRALVRQVARDQFELGSPEGSAAKLERIFYANGWLFESKVSLPESSSEVKLDFWLPVGHEGLGVGIFLSNSLFHREAAVVLARRASEALAMLPADSVLLLVVNGYLAESIEDALRVFRHRFVQSHPAFEDNFEAILKGLRAGLENAGHEDVLQLIKSKLDELDRQSDAQRRLIERLARNSLGPARLSGAVEVGLQKAFQSVGSSNNLGPGYLPRVTPIFEDLTARLSHFARQQDELLDSLFGLARPEERGGMKIHPMESGQVLSACALIQATERAVSSFHRAIVDVLELEDGKRVLPQLGQVCQAFDEFIHSLVNYAEIEKSLAMLRDMDEYVGGRRPVWPFVSPDELLELPRRVYDELSAERTSSLY